MSPAGDLLIIVPSRARPGNAERLLSAVHETAKLATHVHLCVDEDDPELEDYEDMECGPGDRLEIGPRKGLARWTNEIAVRRAGEYPFLASFGDDMVPRTAHWDYFLTRAIEDSGGTGFTYPWDGIREDVPRRSCSAATSSPRWAGCACRPCQHFFVDNAWADLGRGAGCLRHCRAVAVDHVHPRAGTAERDKTYSDACPKLDADRDAYQEWRRTRMAG